MLAIVAGVLIVAGAGGVLDRDHSGDCLAASDLPPYHAEPRERQDDVQLPAAARPATPFPTKTRQGRSHAARRRTGAALPFGTFYVPNISPDPTDGIGDWSEADFVSRAVGRNGAGRTVTCSRLFPITSYPPHEAQRRARSVCVSENLAAGAGKVRGPRSAVSIQHPPRSGCVESAVSAWRPVRGRPVEIGAMEPRRLSGKRTRTLRRVPQPAQSSRRHHRERALRRRPVARRQRLGAEHHAGRPRPLGDKPRTPGRRRISRAFSSTA